MAVCHERVVLAVHGVELSNILNDDVDLAAVSGDIGQRLLHYWEFSQAGELVQQEQQAVFVPGHASTVRKLHLGADAAHNHIHHEPQQRTHPVNIRRGYDKIQIHRLFMVHQVMDAEITGSGIERHNRIAVQRQIGQRRGNHAGGFVFRLV